MVSTATATKSADISPDAPRVTRPPDIEPAAPEAPKALWRKRIFLGIGLLVLIVAGIVGGRYVVWSWHHESTDDAYLEAHVVPVSAKVGGYVRSVFVNDNQHVTAGDVLVTIDPRDYEAAIKTAEAEVAAARAKLEEANTSLTVYASRVDQAKAELAASDATTAFAASESKRYASIGENAVSVQEQANAKTAADVAAANSAASRSKLTAAQAEQANGRSQVESAKAELATAEAKARQPQLDLAATKIIAPVTGRVTKRNVEEGVYLSPAQGLFAIVPDDFYVIANFKETQLMHMQPGQPVSISIDAYPGHEFTGHVDSIQRGTGGRFSLLPAENATGNFVKIVQRVPVKIVLDNLPDGRFTLAPGMSVEPDVTVR